MTSIAVETVVSSGDLSWFDRWLDAVIAALNAVARNHVVTSWRIIVETAAADAAFGETTARSYRHLATAAGGAIDFREAGAGARGAGELRALADTGDTDLVLVLDSNVIILPSSLERLLAAHRSGPVAAREIPLEGAGLNCVLLDRQSALSAQLAQSATVDQPFIRCAEAVVFSRAGEFGNAGTAGDRESVTSLADGSLLEQTMVPSAFAEARRSVEELLAAPAEPLLSIVMRTQGYRPEPLRDALLCLAGQSDGRFELLLVVHDSDADSTQRILDDQPSWLRSRTTVLAASGGTRSRPLNVGISASTGSHIAFLDDDDLVFSTWVAAFLDAAPGNARRLLRAIAGVQHVAAIEWPGGLEGHATVSGLSTPYPARFDLADHLRVNMTPFMAFAFPRSFFTVFGGADESLEVCEDWDLVLRAASVLGVADVPAVTAIYRRWDTGRDSYSIHDTGAWDRDMAIVRAKLDALPMLLPPGAASELAALSAARGASAELTATFSSSSWRITAPLRAISRRTRKPDPRGHG